MVCSIECEGGGVSQCYVSNTLGSFRQLDHCLRRANATEIILSENLSNALAQRPGLQSLVHKGLLELASPDATHR